MVVLPVSSEVWGLGKIPRNAAVGLAPRSEPEVKYCSDRGKNSTPKTQKYDSQEGGKVRA